MHAMEMMSSHPDVRGKTDDALVRCIEECFDCAQVCTVCADACLGEDRVHDLRQCIRLDLDCADVCLAVGRMASRRTGSNVEGLHSMLVACAEVCRACAAECGRHAVHHEHCRICADSCERCARACDAAAGSVH